jgi:chromosome segregation ATPase
MRLSTRTQSIVLGLLLGTLVNAPLPVYAQFTVFDPSQYALQVEKKIEEAQRWVETIQHYAQMYEKAVQQLTTLQGVLTRAESMVLQNRNLVAIVADVGRSVRGIFLLKRQLTALVTYRIRALQNIADRLRDGIFDLDADKADLENYLKNTIGRQASDKVATWERMANMDNELERWATDRHRLEVQQVAIEQALASQHAKLQEEENKPDPDKAHTAQIIEELGRLEQLKLEIIKQINDLTEKITERCKRYGVELADREQFGNQVDKMDHAWRNLLDIKPEVMEELRKYEPDLGF